MDISFDPAKRAQALSERGLDFANAGLVFGNEVATRQDHRDYPEDRFITGGYLAGRMVVMVWTPRGTVRHIISMRYCHAREQALWLRRMG